MKHCQRAFAVLIATAAAATAAAGTQLWDFSGGIEDWEVANGTWKTNNGVLQQTDGAMVAAHAIVGETNWDDYVVHTKIRIDEGNWAGLIFRAQDEFQYYVYYLNVPNNKSELWKHNPGAFNARNALNSNIAAEGVQVTRGDWIHVKAEVEGGDFTLYINDELQAEQSEPAYAAGAIGLWSWTTKASFDDLTITGDNVKDTLSVQPNGKLASQWAALKRR